MLGSTTLLLACAACGQIAGSDAGLDGGDAALQPPPPGWSDCVGRTSEYGSCDQYCAAKKKTCSARCTTSRGYPNLAAEAWHAGEACSGDGAGQQTCSFAWDDVVDAPVRWRCCCK